MVRLSLSIVFLFLSLNLSTQNLVPNPGFEEFHKLPERLGQIDRAKYWTSTSRDSSDWAFGRGMQSSFFHKDAPSPEVRIPYINAGGFTFQKYTKSGKGMGGIIAYGSAPVNRINYLQTSLTKELEKGEWYYIAFYILKRPDWSWYLYSDAIGAAFSDSLYIEEIDGVSALSLDPDIQNVNGLIRDTINWTLINGCYQAKGGESHLIIGNFKNTEETYVEKGHPTAGPWLLYYYIDDVAVIPMQRKSQELILCEDTESIELNAAYWNAEYLWNTGNRDSVLIVDQPGVYTVDVSLGDCFFTDTFVVHGIQAIDHWDHTDTTICDGHQILLESPIPGNIQWSTGDSTTSIEIDQSGLYSLNISNTCGSFQLSKYVDVKDCTCHIYIPNAFSPNGDGVNDYFEIFPYCDFDLLITHMAVYNRWGERVYYSIHPQDNPWDGTFNQRELDSGPFTYILEYEYFEASQWLKEVKTGVVNLMR